MMIKRRTPYVTQLGNMDCGIACLTMIFNYYGVKVDIVDVGSAVSYTHLTLPTILLV